MSGTSPLHGAVYVQDLARDLLSAGYSETQVFGGTGFGPDLLEADRPMAGFENIAGFFQHGAALTGNDVLGFQRGQKRGMRRSGLLYYVGRSAPTVRDMLRNTARYRRVFTDAVEIDITALEQDGVLKWHYTVPAEVKRRQYVEFGVSGLLHSVRTATGQMLRPERVTFRHMRKTHLNEFTRFLGCDVQFGCAHNMMIWKPHDLDRPLQTADNELYSVLRDHCRLVLQGKGRNVPPLIVDVERVITERLSSGDATQDQVARELGMSARTLSRRLSEENTTYFSTLESLRRALSSSYLRDSDLSLTEIAYLLGYSGLSSFSEAFKRWTGQSPRSFRTG